MTAPSEFVLDPLRQGAEFMLYRGRRHDNSLPVLAVAPATEQPSPQVVCRLEHEHSLAAELDPMWAAIPLGFTRHEGRTALILKDPGGEPLDRFLERDSGQPLDLTRFLRLAIGMATALGEVHRRGLIHKDVKPANMLADDAGNVWLTGFGIASRLPHDRQTPAPPEIVAGTLAYMSPEQTGRMNRSIDARSDLYSLGVTLYQMLTGVLPFAARDPLEWVHCHIARQPVAPDNLSEVPGPLSAIIMKLLAKNAEERYQAATGLVADLRRCLQGWQSLGRIDPFPLGADDLSERLLIPEKLYGREREVEVLVAAFDRMVTQGTAELVLVSGFSGVGKSSVVNELHKVLVPQRGLFAAGKFDQYKRDVPYATLAQAFQMLVRQVLVKNEAEVGQWRQTLLDAVGPNGQLMVNLIPEVEFLIGKQPPVPDLPPQEARNRFQLVFRRFLGAFASPEHPLALFLDDLQWLDTATLELLERLISDPDVRHVLLIGAYRDNEVSPSHPLMQRLATIRETGARTQEIVLAPLGPDDVGRLVSDSLRSEREATDLLARLVHEKTGGNPFFAIQFLMELVEEELLRLDRDAAGWIWDMDRIRSKGYSASVVDLMLGKLKRLPARTQNALQQLACLGNVVEIATLSLVFGQSEEELYAALLDAARAGLILCLEGSYTFLHDRIQEAAYALIPESEREGAHLRIGRALLAGLTSDGLAEHLFDVANQLNRGAALLIDRDEKVRVAAIDLSAGRKAKASAAYASARAYFAAGMALLEESNWSSDYALMFSLWLERAECEFLTGHLDTAGQLIVELMLRGESKVDKAAVYHLKVQLHGMKSENQQAVATALTCLRLLSIEMPSHPTPEQVQAEYETFWQALNGRPIESLIDLPLMTDPEMSAAMRVFSVLLAPTYFTDHRLWCLQVCRTVKISLQHGTSGDSASAFGFWGVVLGLVCNRYGEGYRFAKLAGDLVDKHGFIASQAKVYASLASVAIWTQPIETAVDFWRTSFRAAIETGDPTFACFGAYSSVTCALLRNDPLDLALRQSEMALDFARKARYGDAVDIAVSQQRFIAAMQGRTATFSTFSDAQFNEATFEAQLAGGRTSFMIGSYWILKLKARFLSGDYVEALAAAAKTKELLPELATQITLLDYFYYSALAVAGLYETASADQQQAWDQLLKAHREQLREWAENYPPTFADKHALVSAEIARLEKRDLDPQRLYEQAIHLAREHGFVQNQGLAHELAAQYHLARGLETAGYAHLRNARNCYDRWGAHGKVKQLDERYPRLREERTSAASATIGQSAGQFDIETVVKASQALSSEMVLPKVIEKLVRIALEHAGAERGLLILVRGGEPRMEAEATTGHGRVEVAVRQAAVTPSDLPQSALHYVIRTEERVLLDDASADSVYSKDEYVRQKRSKSVLCLPIVKQAKLVGALYLENSLTPCAFTPDRVTVLELLASQAAISLENAGLYSDLQRSEAFLVQGQRLSQTSSFGWSVSSGEIYWSEENYNILEYDRANKPSFELAVDRFHPEDREFALQTLEHAIRERSDFDLEHRLLMPDGRVKHVHIIGRALTSSSGNLDFVGAITDVTAARQAEDRLRRSEAFLAQAQRISQTGSFGWDISSGEIFWSDEIYDLIEYDRGVKPTLELIFKRIHPDDKDLLQQTVDRAAQEKMDFDIEHRVVMPDGRVKHVHLIGRALKTGNLDFVGAVTDITAAKQAEEKLRRSEAFLAQGQRLSQTGTFGWSISSGELYWSDEMFNIIEYDQTVKPTLESVFERIHPDDKNRVQQTVDRSTHEKADFDLEHRLLMPDGRVKHVRIIGRPLRASSGNLDFMGAVTDVTATKLAEEKIRQSESELRQILDLAPQHVYVLGPDPNSMRLFANQAALDYFGLTFEQWRSGDIRRLFHPDDWERTNAEAKNQLAAGLPHEVEMRLRGKDGKYRWFLSRRNPLRDEHGRLTRWYTAATDIEDRKAAEQRLKDENVSLREEIDRASMFEEIVGTSAPLKKVVSRISKVAPTDSGVLITGETGTGKELVARAIHRRSRRSSYPFVSVNCAVIPRDLIASELFGHEKGSFTGAIQRRLGRFELAEKGTIFLDEIGELPAETQIALLRVLQEHEFERVGGTESIRTNVRVIAATNRDLESAIASGTFRSDLFYRLNVFPIEMPPLRKRKEDIPLLVAYFLNHYARKAGRRFTAVDKMSLDLLQSYAWPGNIRELQNVIERSVIISETETFSVDESWLSRQPPSTDLEIRPGLFNRPPAEEKAVIEAALRECEGRVYGPSGAAARLGMPRTTLESKIKSLKINKNRFKGTEPLRNG